jgi:group I intron endonuclease
LLNVKFYIGQSRDIYTRWKSHTISIKDSSNESVIRMAFAKYGLRNQVSSEGIFSGFQFEIIERCAEEKLLERESHYIETLKPEYNIMLIGANPIFPKRDTQNFQKFIQYHSFDKMGYLPGESEDDSITTENSNYGIYTKKRVAINMLGSSIALIVGGKPGNNRLNRYYLWSELAVEDIQYDHEFNDYIVQGIENLMIEPIDLTDLEGFTEFKMKCGNFAYGLQSMKNKQFYHNTIAPILSKMRIKKSMSYNQWIDNFLLREKIKFS